MNFSKEDQNTFLLVAAILVVCIVTIIVIFSLIWNIIAPPIKDFGNSVSYFFKTQQPVDYNFPIPPAPINPEPQPTLEPEKTTAQNPVKYDLPFKDAQVLGTNAENISNQPIVKEAINSKYLSGNDVTQVKFNVQISSIGLNAPAMLGNDSQFILQNGFYIYPGSDLIDNGEITLLCYRSQFKSTDPRSCWNLDKLQKDDEIILDNSGSQTKYKIIGTNVFNFASDFIYKKDEDTSDSYLQIVTNDGNSRLVILARKE